MLSKDHLTKIILAIFTKIILAIFIVTVLFVLMPELGLLA